jgi:hypothetical protein
LARRIHLPFDNGNSTVRSLVHILVWVLNDKWRTPKLLVRLKMGLECQTSELFRKFGACSQLSALEGVEGHVEAPGLD